MIWIILAIITCHLICGLQAAPSAHHHHKRGQLPLSVSSVEALGDVHSEDTFVLRDLGFPGTIGNNTWLSYGDTIYSDAQYEDINQGMTSDSIALATSDPTKVYDTNLNSQGFPQQFCPIMEEYNEDASTYALGITNVVETGPGEGTKPTRTSKNLGMPLMNINRYCLFPAQPSPQPCKQYSWCRGRHGQYFKYHSCNSHTPGPVLVEWIHGAVVWEYRRHSI